MPILRRLYPTRNWTFRCRMSSKRPAGESFGLQAVGTGLRGCSVAILFPRSPPVEPPATCGERSGVCSGGGMADCCDHRRTHVRWMGSPDEVRRPAPDRPGRKFRLVGSRRAGAEPTDGCPIPTEGSAAPTALARHLSTRHTAMGWIRRLRSYGPTRLTARLLQWCMPGRPRYVTAGATDGTNVGSGNELRHDSPIDHI
jgi:hypothetical protein